MSFSHSIYKTNSSAEIINPNLITIVFGHHPCPDGIAAIVCLAEKFGMQNASYQGLNHAKPDEMRKSIFSAIGSQPANIIFADIIPPFEILKELLEKTTCTITLLDHHATAKSEIDGQAEYLRQFTHSNLPRLQIELDMTRSGAGIAYDYAIGKKERPVYISLVQAIDLLTATANTDVIKQFNKNTLNIDSNTNQLFHMLSSLTDNVQIKSNIEFYVFAAIFDLHMKKSFKDNNNQMNNTLMACVKRYFDLIEKNGLTSLLQATGPDAKETNLDIEKMFREQLEYQKNAVAKAKVIPSLLNGEMDILFVEADIQNGRTFDPLIAQKLAGLPRPTIAMVVNTQNISDNNWVALRAADNTINLYEIASQYKIKKLATNAGGHARASALQLSRDQISTFYNIAYQKKQSYTDLSVFVPPTSSPTNSLGGNDEVNIKHVL